MKTAVLKISSTSQKIETIFHFFPFLCHRFPVSLSASFIACIWTDKFLIFERKNIEEESSVFF